MTIKPCKTIGSSLSLPLFRRTTVLAAPHMHATTKIPSSCINTSILALVYLLLGFPSLFEPLMYLLTLAASYIISCWFIWWLVWNSRIVSAATTNQKQHPMWDLLLLGVRSSWKGGPSGPRKMSLPWSPDLGHVSCSTEDQERMIFWVLPKNHLKAQLKAFFHQWYPAVNLAMELKLLRKYIFQNSGCSIDSISLAEGNSDKAS